MDANERLLVMLADIKEDIGGLRADVSNVHRRLDEKLTDDTSLRSRVGKLEHAHTKLKTMSAVLSVTVSAGFALGLALLKGYPWAH